MFTRLETLTVNEQYQILEEIVVPTNKHVRAPFDTKQHYLSTFPCLFPHILQF